jgi:hypothetical protein
MLFMSMFAVATRHIALSTGYRFKAGPDVFELNAMSLATAASMLSAAVFTLCSHDGQAAATVQSGQDTFIRVSRARARAGTNQDGNGTDAHYEMVTGSFYLAHADGIDQ